MRDQQKKFNVCILGATGAVGRTFLSLLEERSFPINQLYLLATQRSAGTVLTFKGQSIQVLDVAAFDFAKADIGLFSAGGSASEQYAPKAAAQGCVVVDNSSHFRMDEQVPLVVPEVNPEAIAQHKQKGIIANPNCSTIQMLVALYPIYQKFGINRINVSTYQSVSGSGKQGTDELRQQTKDWMENKTLTANLYSQNIAFNCLPHVDVFLANGYTKEEMKMVNETRKIFNDDTIEVNPTAVRVPVFSSHSESLHIETKQKITAEEAKALLEQSPGIVVKDELSQQQYPSAEDSADTDLVFVGRIREDISHPLGLNLWVVADNLRKGAATNAVQIAELLAESL